MNRKATPDILGDLMGGSQKVKSNKSLKSEKSLAVNKENILERSILPRVNIKQDRIKSIRPERSLNVNRERGIAFEQSFNGKIKMENTKPLKGSFDRSQQVEEEMEQRFPKIFL